MTAITIVATLQVKPEFTDEVIEFLNRELMEQSRAEAGNIEYVLNQGMNDRNMLCFYEIWASQQAIDLHVETEHFKQFEQYIGDKVTALVITPFTQL